MTDPVSPPLAANDAPDAWAASALAEHRRGAFANAEKLYRQTLAVAPRHRGALRGLAVLAGQLGRFAAAESLLDFALTNEPTAPDLYANRGNARWGQGRIAGAGRDFLLAVLLAPNDAGFLANLAAVWGQRPDIAAGLRVARRAVILAPTYEGAWVNLANVAVRIGEPAQATDAAIRALTLSPQIAEGWCNLGLARRCERDVTRALTLTPTDAPTWFAAADIALHDGHLVAALNRCRVALALAPDFADPMGTIGRILIELGTPNQAMNWYRRDVAVRPDHIASLAGAASAACYNDQATPTTIRAAAVHFGRAHRQAARPTVQRKDSLRVGLLSGDLRAHPVGNYLTAPLPYLSQHNIHLTAYAAQSPALTDAVTERLQQSVDDWRWVHGLRAHDLAAQIAADGIDVLIELSGLSAGGRFDVLALRPAPVQLSWLGFPATTGMAAIDYLVLDQVMLPSSSESEIIEQPLRLPDVAWCYDPPREAPAVSPPPSSSGRPLTFGSLNNPAKLSPSCLALWSQVLAAVPNSRLLLKYRGLDEPETQVWWRRRLGGAGINLDRVIFEGASPRDEALAAYNRIDIALDSLPFAGGATSADALWMGVPVVTMAADRIAGRMTASWLTALALPELIADKVDSYVAIAAGLAAAPDRLARLRAALRPRMAASSLVDAPRFAAALATALREAFDSVAGSIPSPSRG